MRCCEETKHAVGACTLKDVAVLMLETGMRPEEVYRTSVGNLDLAHAHLLIPFGKTKAARRRIPLTTSALAIMKRRAEKAKGVYLFPHLKDKNKPMLKVNGAHKTALNNSKVRNFRLYDLRHTWATRAAEAGMDMPTLAALLGHSELNMVMRYAHPQEEHQAEAVKRLEAFNAAKEIAEIDKQKKKQKSRVPKTVPTVFPTLAENPANSSEENPAIN
jgi:integrase